MTLRPSEVGFRLGQVELHLAGPLAELCDQGRVRRADIAFLVWDLKTFKTWLPAHTETAVSGFLNHGFFSYAQMNY